MNSARPPDAQTQAWMEARTRSRFTGEPDVPTVAEVTPGVTATATGNELIVDLPEGQKVILGRLPLGTIVEIASWRGTGGPDSRTSRLLLGTGSAVSSTGARAGSIASASPTAPGAPPATWAASAPKPRNAARTTLATRITVIAIGVLAVSGLALVILTAILT